MSDQMDDRTLLETAAQAAGWDRTKVDDRGWFYVCTYPDPPEWELWNPLTDDGDALRLSSALGIDIEWEGGIVFADGNFSEQGGSDRNAAARRAVVRAAAYMAKDET